MAEPLPRPVTTTDLYLEAILAELRTLNGSTPPAPVRFEGVDRGGAPQPVGGGWYEVSTPSGVERVRGREAAMRMAYGDL